MTATKVAYENDSDTLVKPAYADYSTKQYYAMYLYSDGRAKICGANADMTGILENKPNAQDQDAELKVRGIAKGVLGYAVTVGNALSTRSDGTFGPQSSTYPKVGTALDSGSAGDIISILLGGGGVTETGLTAPPPGMPPVYLKLTDITTAAAVFGPVTMQQAGKILDMFAHVITADDKSGKAATLYAKINTTAVTGAEVPLTSATCIKTTAAAAIIPSSAAASANDTFAAGDTITIFAKDVTSFAGSAGVINLYIMTSA
jgi:hypothetical protein